MAITAGNIEFRLSGGASNTVAANAIGGAMSTVAGGIITDASLHNLFDKVTGDESAAGDVEYRCIYVKNNHGTLTWEAVKVWVSTQPSDPDDDIDIALAGEGLNGTAETPADEDTAPAGETFTNPANKAAGLALGDMGAGDFYPIWIRRTITLGAGPADTETMVLTVEGDTAA